MKPLQSDRKPALSGQTKSLVVFLHGYGANGADLFDLAEVLAPHLPDTVFMAPDAPEPAQGGHGLQWFPIPWIDGSSEQAAKDGLLRATDDLNAFLDAQLDLAGLTDSALCLLGFSQGAMMAMHVAPRRAVAMAGVVAISGRLLAPEDLDATAVRPAMLLIHGDDDQVVPFDSLAHASKALTSAGFDTYGHVMRGTGHGIASDGLSVALSFLRDRLAG